MPTERARKNVRRRTTARLSMTAAAAVLAAAGCAKETHSGASLLDAADFRSPEGGPAAVAEANPATQDDSAVTQGAGPSSTTAAPPRRPIRMMAASEASLGVLDVSVVPGPPPSTAAATPANVPAAPAVMLDAKVGEINGQPIIASQFLEQIDGRLRALARETRDNPAEWRQRAAVVIFDHLRGQILDQLLLAEAYASLTPQMRDVGLRAFLTQIREDLVRQNQGSRELADQRLLEQEGVTIERKSKEALQQELIRHELIRNIRPRIHVSTRDQREHYDRNFAQFNPPGVARLRLIQVPASNQEGVEAVRAAIQSGSFEDAARLEFNLFRRHAGGEHTVQVPGLYEEAEFFGVPELNDAARALEPGMTIGPIPARDTVAWVHLVEVDRPPGVSFYDAQLDIARLLLQQKEVTERRRYEQQLFNKGSFSDIVETTERLLGIATERYFGTLPQ